MAAGFGLLWALQPVSGTAGQVGQVVTVALATGAATNNAATTHSTLPSRPATRITEPA